MTQGAKSEVLRLRKKTPFLTLQDPSVEVNPSLLPPPNAIKSKPSFSTNLKSRIIVTCSYKQPFSRAEGMVTITQGGTALLWDVERMKKYERFSVTRGGVMTAAVNKSGSLLISGGLGCNIDVFSIGHDLTDKLYGEHIASTLPLYDDEYEFSVEGRPSSFRTMFCSHSKPVSALAFCEDSKAFSFGRDGNALAFDVVAGVVYNRVDYVSPINTGTAVPNRPFNYVLGLRSGRVFVGDTREKRPGVNVMKSSSLEKIAVLEDGNTMVVANNEEVDLVDLRSFGSYNTFTSKDGPISSIDVSPSGRMLICGTDYGSVNTLDILREEWGSKPIVKRHDRISGVHLCGNKICVASWDGNLSTYKIKN